MNNFSVTIQGYVDASNNLPQAMIALDGSATPNVTIDNDGSSSTYTAPNCGTGSPSFGPIATLENTGNTGVNFSVNNMTAKLFGGSGAPTPCDSLANFVFSAGSGDTCHNLTGSVSGITCN